MKNTIVTQKTPKAICPYSHVIDDGNLTSGQLPIDVSPGKVKKSGIKKAAKNSLENCKAILAGARLSLGDVVKTLVFMTNLSEFAARFCHFYPRGMIAWSD